MKNKLWLILLSLIVITTPVLAVWAAADPNAYTLLEPGAVGGKAGDQVPSNFLEYIGIFYQALLGITITLAIIYIVIGGLQYMTSAAASGKGDGKKKMTDALIGLGIALLSYLALYTINPDLVNWKICIPKLPATTCA